jgi:hypothetical protein
MMTDFRFYGGLVGVAAGRRVAANFAHRSRALLIGWSVLFGCEAK